MLKIKNTKSEVVEQMKGTFVERVNFNMLLDSRLLREFKVATIRRGTTMTDVIKAYITEYVNNDITK